LNTYLHKITDYSIIIFFLFIILSGLSPCIANNAETLDKLMIFYVSPNGNNQWSGTVPTPNKMSTDGPFATIHHARNMIRKLRQEKPNHAFLILVRGGTYRFDEPLSLGPEDSGTESAPLIIRAYGSDKPILSGAKSVKGFMAHKGNIFISDLKDTPLARHTVRQVFADRQRQILARFPDTDPRDPIGSGFLYVEDSIGSGSRIKFRFSKNTFHQWQKSRNAEIFIYPGPNYWNNIIPIAEIDKDQRIITLAENATYPIKAGNRYYIQNALEELDAPGEWYFDQKEKKLYYWPSDNNSLKNITVPYISTILEITGKKLGNKYYGAPSHIRIEGLTMEGCEGSAILINGAKHTVIAGNTIYNAGGNGINIQDGFENTVSGNDIYEVGGNGIIISGGNRKTLIPAKNRAENNYIRHVGVFTKASSGIFCSGVGNIIAHNLIRSTPRIGIWFDGNNHVIEYNHVHNVNQETQDSGAIYSCARDWTKRGSIVRFNYIHNTGGYGRKDTKDPWQRPFYTYGIYLDDFTSETAVYGNIVAKAYQGAIFIHGGRDNNIENNMIIEGKKSQMVYSSIRSDYEGLPAMFAKINDMNYTRYPLLLSISNTKEGRKMSGNRFIRNIIYYTGKNAVLYDIQNEFDPATTISDHNIIYHNRLPLLIPFTKVPDERQWHAWLGKGMDLHSLTTDPLFSNIAKGDFTLTPASEALKIGFEPIPFEKIGLYKDPLRASWPIKE